MGERIKHLFKDGFFHILGSSFINKCIAFITNIILVRILSKNDFGVFTGAFNAFFIIFLFSGMGITSGILYFCSKDISKDEKSVYYHYSFKFGLISEILLSLALILYGLFGNVGIEETRPYIISLAGMPFIAFVFDYFSIILRAEKSNIKYSKLMNINSLLYLAFGSAGAFVGGIAGTIIGRYAAYIITGIIGWYYCKPFIASTKEILSKDKKKDLTFYSFKAGITSALNVILYRLDVAIIAIVVVDASVLASYKTGTTLPENLNFIPQCVMIYFLPILIQNASDKVWLKNKVKQIYLLVGAISVTIGAIIIIFAPLIVKILWGEQYMDSVPCMRILSVSFIVLSTFRVTSTNILLGLKRAGYTLIVSIVTGVSNIILDVILTVKFGSIGAAYATLIVTILAAAMSFPFVIHVIRTDNENKQ